DGERGRPPGGAAGAVDMEDIRLGDAKIVAERRRPRLRGAQILLLDDRDLRLKVLERLQVRRVKSGFVPFVLVERGVRVGVGADLLQAFENQRFAPGRGHGLAFAKPVAAGGIRKVVFVVGSRKGPRFHCSQRAPRWATSSRSRATILSSRVSCSSTSLTPICFNAAASSSGMTPPATTIMSSAPSSLRRAKILGITVICVPDRRLTPRISASS